MLLCYCYAIRHAENVESLAQVIISMCGSQTFFPTVFVNLEWYFAFIVRS